MKAIGLFLLFLFAIVVFGFVAYVWQSADEKAPPPQPFPPPTTVVPAP